MWGMPAILLIAAVFSGALGLTSYLLYVAGATAVLAVVWGLSEEQSIPYTLSGHGSARFSAL